MIDRKIPLHEKEDVLVLISGNEIVWVVGHQLDDRYKLVTSSSNIPTTKINNIQNRNILKQITNSEENCFLNNKIITNKIIASAGITQGIPVFSAFVYGK